MRAYVGVTDRDWFEFLRAQEDLDEVNFWQPGGRRLFKALARGELFLFKLHSPRNFIVGGGLFAHSTLLPLRLAWDTFGRANGARSLTEMRERVERYRRGIPDPRAAYTVGCILLEQPFFLPESHWIPVPEDWKPTIVQGKGYDLEQGLGRDLWQAVQRAVAWSRPVDLVADTDVRDRWGRPSLTYPRLGQGSFRVLITDAYQRRCAFTRERTLPALEAAHIVPYGEGGEHRVDNGLLLRRDLHALFDEGYLTVTPEHRVEVSGRIREEFENGRDYYALNGNRISVPEAPELRPSPAFLAWHNERKYLG